MKISTSFALLTALGAVSVVSASERPAKPNVLFILTDDLGWQDLKCYDVDEPSFHETPRIDALAKEGVMFWQAYSPAPTSAPTRGAILSGKHPARLQRTHVVGGSPVFARTPNSATITPWYSGRLPIEQVIIPELLKGEGYVSGHIGKWHVAIDHRAYPQPKDHGFDFSIMDVGVTAKMKNRLQDFASEAEGDKFRLDENGYPRDQNNINALEFMDNNKEKPFFLYYCTWLVHAPIQTRAKHLLDKYVKKMGVPMPTNPAGWTVEGQRNPYYAAMVEMLDYYTGQLLDYLKTTDDPRWPGHKLIENTYVIFTSDNGGMEGTPRDIYTDNYPLDKGKINIEEGGIRVPFIVTGPGIPKNVQSDVMINGLDILPTIMSWTKIKVPSDLILDGADISTLLAKNPKDKTLVKEQDGKVRNSIMHHFPHSRMESSLRIDGYKLIHNYTQNGAQLQLFELYDKDNKRSDIEEMKDLAKKMPEKAKQMDEMLMQRLKAMDASFPYYNPSALCFKAKKENFVTLGEAKREGSKVSLTFTDKGYKIVDAYIIYTQNGGQKAEEWFRLKAKVDKGRVTAQLPEGTTHYIFGLVDSENFWFNYPQLRYFKDYEKEKYSVDAIKYQ